MLADRIKALTGDEYTLMDFYGWLEKAKILHNICGKSHSYLPDNFSKGSRCPYCRKILRNDQIQELLENASNGAYTIAKFWQSGCIVINTETNEEIRTTTPRVKQEIFRPTPSDFLPLIQKGDAVQQKTTAWDIAFGLYKSYKAEVGGLPPKGKLYHDFDLGLWCQHQRDDYRKGRLSQERTVILNEAGFEWDPLDDKWQANYGLYKKYIAEKGYIWIGVQMEYEGERLGLWVRRQRERYQSGKLLKNRERMLLEIAPNIFGEFKKAGSF